MTMLTALLDPERREKAARDQEKLRAILGPRVVRRPAQAKYLYGMARERLALDQLSLAGDVADISSTPDLANQLAEGLALQCRFTEAAAIAASEPHAAEYKAKALAVEHVNEQMCADPPTQPHGGHHGLSADAIANHPGEVAGVKARQESTQLAFEELFNGKVTIRFTKCLLCGALSAYA